MKRIAVKGRKKEAPKEPTKDTEATGDKPSFSK